MLPRRQRRGQAEKQTGAGREDDGVEQDRAIHQHFRRPRGKALREADQHTQRQGSNGQPDGAARRRYQNAFGQQLDRQAPPAGPQRGTHRHFPLQFQQARQHHVGDIGAGDQQDESGHGQQNQKRRLRLARKCPVQRRGGDSEATRPVAFRMSGRHLSGGHSQIGPRLLHGHSGPQTAEHRGDQAEVRVGDIPGAGARRTLPCRHVDVALHGVLRNWRQDADHRGRQLIHLENLADDVRVAAVPALPILVTHYQHRAGSGGVAGK